MQKSDVKFYSNTLIQADIEFLKFQCSKRNVALLAETGLQRLIDDCQAYIDLPPNAEVYNTTIKPLLVLYSLSDTLRMLWLKRKEFRVQLTAMNTGTYEYGIKTESENNFKDFELELFSAAYLNEYGVNAELPQNTEGNDILYREIEIQCKHPEVFTRKKIDSFLRDFQSSLQQSQKYGVLGLGLDDYLGFTDTSFPIDYASYERAYREALHNQDIVMQEILDDTLRFCPRVLGVYIVNTHFTYNTEMGLSLMKTTNSVFCLRPNAREVSEEMHRQAYEVISVFNNKPAFRSY